MKGNFNELALFAGAGGGILGGLLLGWKTVCAVEINTTPVGVLIKRQNEGFLSPFPIWDDVSTFDGKPWKGLVDVVSGGFPCQDISITGKGVGISGSKSGLWVEMARIVCEVRPRFVLVENSPMLVRRGLARVVSDLAKMGYDSKWGIVGADDIGANHARKRIWILAYPNGLMFEGEREKRSATESARLCARKRSDEEQNVSNSGNDRSLQRLGELRENQQDVSRGSCDRGRTAINEGWKWWENEPRLGRVAYGVDNRVDRLQAIGNGQVPDVVRFVFETLRNA